MAPLNIDTLQRAVDHPSGRQTGKIQLAQGFIEDNSYTVSQI